MYIATYIVLLASSVYIHKKNNENVAIYGDH